MNKELLKDIVILYIEDDDEIREFTSNTIATIIKKIIVASNGIEGLEKFKENEDINLILTDINMPKMDGIEMCEKIREINKDIPIIITSAHTEPLFLKRSLDINVSSYAMKPIDLYKLAGNICRAYEPIFLKKQLENLKNGNEIVIEEKIKEAKYILNTQNNISFIMHNETLIEANEKFLNFFECENLDLFNINYGNIIKQFTNESGFLGLNFFSKNINWLENFKKLNETDRVVKIVLPNKIESIFSISINPFFDIKDYFIVSLIDITNNADRISLIDYQLNYDRATGLFNSSKSLDILKKEIRRDIRYGNNLSIILLEIEDFNDNTNLKNLSEILINNTREHDTISKWEKNQFLAILPQTDKNGAKIVADKIENSINKNEKNPKIYFGISQLQVEDDETTIVARALDSLVNTKRVYN